MKLRLLTLLLLASLWASAQDASYQTFGANGIKRKISGSDTTYSFNGASSGYLYGKSLNWYRANFAPATGSSIYGKLIATQSWLGINTFTSNNSSAPIGINRINTSNEATVDIQNGGISQWRMGIAIGETDFSILNTGTLGTAAFRLNQFTNVPSFPVFSTNGLLKTTGGTGTLAIATAGTDYMAIGGDYVNKTTNQTSIAGDKGWVGLHTFGGIGTALTLSRALSTGSSVAYGVNDLTAFSRTSGNYSGFRSAQVLSGSPDYYHGFLAIPTSTSNISDLNGFSTEFSVTGGTVGTLRHFYAGGTTGGGTVATEYGLHVPSMTLGTDKWGLYVQSDKSYQGGLQQFGNNVTFMGAGLKSIGWGGNTSAGAAYPLIYGSENDGYLVFNSKAGSPLYLNFDNTSSGSPVNMFAGKHLFDKDGNHISIGYIKGNQLLLGTTTTSTKLLEGTNTGTVLGAMVSSDNTTTSVGGWQAMGSATSFSMLSHAMARTGTRYGAPIAGFAEIFVGNNGSGVSQGLIIGTQPNKPIKFGTNNLERMRIMGAGNVLVGDTTDNTIGKLQVNGYITAQTPAASDNSTKVATTAYVDNAVSASGATSGTYTPTATNVSNTSMILPFLCHYIRVGNQVTVTGKVDATATATGQATFNITLPIASNIGATTDVEGLGQTASSFGGYVIIFGDATNDRASITFTAASTSSGSMSFTFMYTVI